jgi:hypothetical protein
MSETGPRFLGQIYFKPRHGQFAILGWVEDPKNQSNCHRHGHRDWPAKKNTTSRSKHRLEGRNTDGPQRDMTSSVQGTHI